ncbi:hypothetical protein [Speluncibacter jeojiensis]|uniref:Uncharacterized protein n=1 Tax=Speluncibacter jeojiensis TaxID=2710754 RepID=A0A9X4M1W6_9ACTN|nr:hypothetical protein [Rhodococcus sp. D2-41]MDG3016500.1 hypothetical protein [Corynebacteriales bacterium D3-21]
MDDARRRSGLPRLLLLIPGGFALLAGLDAALLLLGVSSPVTGASLARAHGILMTLGFVGTVVALERAVALGRAWGYLAPASLGIGAVSLVTPTSREVGAALLLAGTVALAALYVPLWRRNHAAAVLIQAIGAILGVGAATLWAADVPVPSLLPWLVCFLVLTISGERLELARIALGDPRAEPLAVLISVAVAAALTVSLLWPAAGYPLLGAALITLVAWLCNYDVARKTLHSKGLPRFSAACLLAGYGWLAVTACWWLFAGSTRAGASYDAVVHSVFLGFVMSMIMAHAPIIFPAVLRRPLPYSAVMYGPAVLLQLSLLVRIGIGDSLDVAAAVQIAGVLNVVSVLAFVAVAVWSATKTPAAQSHSRPHRSRRPTAAGRNEAA